MHIVLKLVIIISTNKGYKMNLMTTENGFTPVAMTKEYGEVLQKGNRYYYLSRSSFRNMPLSKAKFQASTLIEAS